MSSEVVPARDPGSMLAVVASSLEPAEAAAAEVEEFRGSIQDLCQLRGRLAVFAQAARTLRRAVDSAIARELGPNAGLRYGDQFFRPGPGRSWKLLYPDQFLQWVGPDLASVVNVASSVQVSRVRALAAKRGEDPEVVLATFGDYVEDSEILKVVPLAKAPAWAQRLEDGQRSFRKGVLLGDDV